MPILHTRSIIGRARRLCPSNAHPQLWCLSAPLHHLSIRSRVRFLMHSQLGYAHIVHWRHTWEGQETLSVECTLSTLVSTSSSPSPMSAKLCSMSVHRSVQELDFLRIVSRRRPILYTGGKLWRAWRLCPSNAHPQIWCLSAPVHHLSLLNFVPWVCIDPFKS